MSSTSPPSVSIITPTWNSAATITRTVESILSQTLVSFEHIIVDNLSSDNTLEIVRALYQQHGQMDKLRIYSAKDNGISDAFNKGVSYAQAPLVAILNGDDAYANSSILQTMWNEFQKNHPDAIHGDLIFEDENIGNELRKPLNCDVRLAMPFNHPTMFISKIAYEKVGLYDETFRLAMDYEWIVRSQKFNLKFLYLPQVITIMDGRGASANQEAKSFAEIEKALQKHGYWDNISKKALANRRLRFKIKTLLLKAHIHLPIKIWRKIKFS